MASDDNEQTPRSIGQPESMRNQEQRMRDGQGGSELTSRPEAHPVGAPGETASAQAEGPPPDQEEPQEDDRPRPGANEDETLPVRSSGPPETTLPADSPLRGDLRQRRVKDEG